MLILSLVISLVIISAFFLQYTAYRSNLGSLAQISLENHQSQIKNVREMTMSSTELIFQEVIATPQVERIFSEALKEDDAGRLSLKSELETLLREKYKPNLSEQFRSIIFHLRDGATLYVLNDSQETSGGFEAKLLVDLVHRSNNAMYGYQDGNTYGGMCYIYPVFYRDEYVGAVEFCVSSEQLFEQIREIFSCICTRIISGDHLEKKYMGIAPGIYLPMDIDGYYIEKSFSDDLHDESNYELSQSLGELDEFEILSELLTQKDFVISKRIEGRYFSLVFLSFSTVDGEHVGYEVFYEPHDQADYIYQIFYSNSALLMILWLLVLASLFVIQRNRELQISNSSKDHLTQVGNRNKLDEVFIRESQRVDRYGGVLSLIIFDIDNFKSINDRFGHLAGDKILIEVSQLIEKTIRSTDTIVRWGGDEFIILLPAITLSQAQKVAIKLQDRVVAYVPSVRGLDTVLISVGAGEYEEGEDIDNLVSRADQEMYQNKEDKQVRYENTLV
jgi:diguanylate cyclase (GGDEF)-like protein